MITGGTGGANTTKAGNAFEIKTDLQKSLKNSKYDLSNIKFYPKRTLPSYLKTKGINMRELFGKEFWPDEAFIYNNHLYIIEKKTQTDDGSVDEKIQAGPYKKLVYDTCAEYLKLNGATFIFLLDKYFNAPKYTTHQIPYNIKNGVPVYFEKIPLEDIFDRAA